MFVNEEVLYVDFVWVVWIEDLVKCCGIVVIELNMVICNLVIGL